MCIFMCNNTCTCINIHVHVLIYFNLPLHLYRDFNSAVNRHFIWFITTFCTACINLYKYIFKSSFIASSKRDVINRFLQPNLYWYFSWFHFLKRFFLHEFTWGLHHFIQNENMIRWWSRWVINSFFLWLTPHLPSADMYNVYTMHNHIQFRYTNVQSNVLINH